MGIIHTKCFAKPLFENKGDKEHINEFLSGDQKLYMKIALE